MLELLKDKAATSALIAVACIFAATPILANNAAPEDDKDLENMIWTANDSQLARLELLTVRKIQINPKDVYAFYLLSHINLRKFSLASDNLSSIKTATDLAQHAIELEPNKDLGYLALAESLDTMGQTEQAIQLLGNLPTIGVGSSWRYYFTLARLHSAKSEASFVLGLLESAISHKDSIPDIIVPYVVAVLENSLSGEELLNSLQNWNQRSSNPLFEHTIAINLSTLGKHEQAHLIYSSIYKRHPTFVEAKLNDAILLYQKLGKANEANLLFKQILSEKNEKSALSTELKTSVTAHSAASLLAANKLEEGSVLMISALKETSDQTAMLEFVTKTFRESKYKTQLPDFIKRLVFEIKPTGLLYALIGESLSEDQQRHEEALKYFSSAILLEPTRSDYYNGMGLTFFRLKKHEQALSLFKEASRVDPDDASAIYNGACALAQLGKIQDALGALQNAFMVDPKLADHAAQDSDLIAIRGSSEFNQLISNAKKSESEISSANKAILGH